MIRKLYLSAGFAAGYVLGARAGRERYEELVSLYKDFSGRPEVVSAASSVKEQAGGLAAGAKEQVVGKVSSLSGDAGDGVAGSDSDASGDASADVSADVSGDVYPSASGAGAGVSVPGAAPSGSAPDSLDDSRV